MVSLFFRTMSDHVYYVRLVNTFIKIFLRIRRINLPIIIYFQLESFLSSEELEDDRWVKKLFRKLDVFLYYNLLKF